MKKLIILILLFFILGLLGGCAPPADPAAYPVDRSLELAALQQRDFVDSFLQGRWCEAKTLYAASVEGSIRRDDFCAAAGTARLGARLKAYLGQEAPAESAQALRLAEAAGSCPALDADAPPERDRRYTALVEGGGFARLASLLAKEDDALYASVYARKGAAKALEAGHADQALALWELARATDAAHGWVAFLREDWRLRLAMNPDPEEQRAIHARIGILDEQIVPCP